jgi:hypothetical protein
MQRKQSLRDQRVRWVRPVLDGKPNGIGSTSTPPGLWAWPLHPLSLCSRSLRSSQEPSFPCPLRWSWFATGKPAASRPVQEFGRDLGCPSEQLLTLSKTPGSRVGFQKVGCACELGRTGEAWSGVRCRVEGGRDPSHPLRRSGTANEFAHGAVDCSCRRQLRDRTLIWNLRHLMRVLREYEDFYNSHRPHRALDQAAPLRPLPDHVTDLDHFRVRRHDPRGWRHPRISPGGIGFRHPQANSSTR